MPDRPLGPGRSEEVVSLAFVPAIDPQLRRLDYSLRRYFVDAFHARHVPTLAAGTRVLDLGGTRDGKRGQRQPVESGRLTRFSRWRTLGVTHDGRAVNTAGSRALVLGRQHQRHRGRSRDADLRRPVQEFAPRLGRGVSARFRLRVLLHVIPFLIRTGVRQWRCSGVPFVVRESFLMAFQQSHKAGPP